MDTRQLVSFRQAMPFLELCGAEVSQRAVQARVLVAQRYLLEDCGPRLRAIPKRLVICEFLLQGENERCGDEAAVAVPHMPQPTIDLLHASIIVEGHRKPSMVGS